MTIYLTIYYYIVLKNYKIDSYILNYIIKNKCFKEIFNAIEEPILLSIENLEEYTNNTRIDFFHKIFTMIFQYSIKLTDTQFNTSFMDIINILLMMNSSNISEV